MTYIIFSAIEFAFKKNSTKTTKASVVSNLFLHFHY